MQRHIIDWLLQKSQHVLEAYLLIDIRNIRPICFFTNHRDAIRVLVPDTFGFRFALVCNWIDGTCEQVQIKVLIRGSIET